MFPFIDIGKAVLSLIPHIVVNPRVAVFFWLVILLVGFQYRRLERMEQNLFGRPINSFLEQTGRSILFGIAGGTVGSLILIFVGVTVEDLGAGYLLLVALLLMMLNPRFMCFSYAGSLVSLSYLLTGYPALGVPAVAALVAVLHLVEGFLVFLAGGQGAAPVRMMKGGRPVGGFALQKFWPVPVILMLVIGHVNLPAESLISMPDWWPLIPPAGGLPPGDPLFVMFPVAAAIGYSDLALTSTLKTKTRRTFFGLALYGTSLLALAVLSVGSRPLQWVLAFFMALGHEAVIAYGRKAEARGEYLYVNDDRGLLVMAVMPGSPAEKQGIRPMDIISSVNGKFIDSRSTLEEVMDASFGLMEVTLLRDGEAREARLIGRAESALGFGLVTPPEAGDQVFVRDRGGGFLPRTLRRWWKRWTARKHP